MVHKRVLAFPRQAQEMSAEDWTRYIAGNRVPGEHLHHHCRHPRSRPRSSTNQNPGNQGHKQQQEGKMAPCMPLLPLQVSTKQEHTAQKNAREQEKFPMLSWRTQCQASGKEN